MNAFTTRNCAVAQLEMQLIQSNNVHLALFGQLLLQDQLLVPYEMDLQISETCTYRIMPWSLTVRKSIVCYSCVNVGADIKAAETPQI